MRSGDCFIIVYSITDRRSFEEAQSIFDFTKRIRDQDMPVVSGGDTALHEPHSQAELLGVIHG